MKRRSTLTPTTSQKQEASLSPSFVSLHTRPSLRAFLSFFSCIFGIPLVLACSRPITPPPTPTAPTTQQAVPTAPTAPTTQQAAPPPVPIPPSTQQITWVSLPQANAWLKEIQQPPHPQPSQPCHRCERSIRRKLASIRVPPYPLPPDPAPARILLVLRPQGLDLWINGRAVTQGCNLWGSLLMQYPILPTLPQSTLQRDPNALATCFQEVRRRHPNEQRILFLVSPHTPKNTVTSLRDTLSKLPLSPSFRFFAQRLLPPSTAPPKRPPHRDVQKHPSLPRTSTRPSGKQ